MAAGVIGSLGANVNIKVASKTLLRKKIDPVGLISLKKNIFKGKWKQSENACKASSSGRHLLSMNADPTKPAELTSSGVESQLLQPVENDSGRTDRPTASSSARKLLAYVPTFPANITGHCKSLGETPCLGTSGCGWCIHGTYCSILPNAGGRCDGTYSTGYGEPEYNVSVIL